MTTSSLLHKLARFKSRASAIQGGSEQLSSRIHAFEMSIDLCKLVLSQGLPPLTSAPASHQIGDLADHETCLLKERDDGEPLKHGGVVVTPAPDAGFRPDEPRLLVVPEGGALKPRPLSHLTDAQELRIVHRHNLT